MPAAYLEACRTAVYSRVHPQSSRRVALARDSAAGRVRSRTGSRWHLGRHMAKATVQETFGQALDALIEQVRADRSVLAAILCGSMSHDRVWEKSDIDLMLITIDD